ncbi:MAG: DUF2085 domain-containing protein [Salinibacter sp.]
MVTTHATMNEVSRRFWPAAGRRTPAKRTWVWLGAVAVATGLLGMALLPPFVSPVLRALLMDGFSSVCHQMPGRSPHVQGIALAVCDRCLGIYGGLVLGSAATRWWRAAWARIRRWGFVPLALLLVPAGVDWIGPVLGLWESFPLSRALTGWIAGVGGGAFVVDRVLASVARRSSFDGDG